MKSKVQFLPDQKLALQSISQSLVALLFPVPERLPHERPGPYGFRLEPTTVEGIRTKMMVPDPAAADHVRLMFEMYAEPGTSFGDISRYFEENDIKVHGKSLFRPFLSQLLRNPVYTQADLELHEFFKSQGAAVVNDAADFAETNGCYLYQGRDVKEDKDRCSGSYEK